MAAIDVADRPGVGPKATRHRGRRTSGADRVTVILLSIAAFLVVLSMLAKELRTTAPGHHTARVVLVRRVYRTTFVQTVIGGASSSGPAVTQATSSSSAVPSVSAAPVTRTS